MVYSNLKRSTWLNCNLVLRFAAGQMSVYVRDRRSMTIREMAGAIMEKAYQFGDTGSRIWSGAVQSTFERLFVFSIPVSISGPFVLG